MGEHITITMEDTLQDCVDNAKAEVFNLIINFVKENLDMDDADTIVDKLDYDGSVNEIIDGQVPQYTKEQKDIMYLHGDEVERALKDSGLEDNPNMENHNGVAIYAYIDQEVRGWLKDKVEEVLENLNEFVEDMTNDAKDDAEQDIVDNGDEGEDITEKIQNVRDAVEDDVTNNWEKDGTPWNDKVIEHLNEMKWDN